MPNPLRVLSTATALLVVGLSVPVLAAPPTPSGSPGEMSEDQAAGMVDRHMDQLFNRLNVSPEQRAQLDAIRTRHRTQTKDVRASLWQRRRELFALVKSAGATREQAIAKQREVSALQAQLSEARIAAWFDGRAVLTAAQLKQLESLPGGGGQRRWGRGQGKR